MKRTKKISFFMLTAVVLLVGCSTGVHNDSEMVEKYSCINSVVEYSIKAPKSTEQNKYEIFFNAPFYRVCLGDDKDIELLTERDSYEIGEEVQLTGENVEMLNGTDVTIHAARLKECSNYNVPGVIVPNVNDEYIVIGVNLNFNGCIYDNVEIKSLEIPSLEFQFDFKNFSISTFDFAEGDIEDADNAVIDYSSGNGGIFANAALSDIGYVEIEGNVREDIESINIKSLDDAVTVITADNYSMYTELMDTYGILYEKHPEGYEKGSAISERYSYVCNDAGEHADAKMSNILISYKLKDGTVFNKFVYQPRVVDGPYLISGIVDEHIQ